MNIPSPHKFIMTILIFVLAGAAASPPLPARERRGSMVVVTLVDGGKVMGELLAVKEDVLLVYDAVAAQGVSIELRQATGVKVFKKAKFLKGLVIGFGLGFAATMICDTEGRIHGNTSMSPALMAGLIGGALGVVAGMPEKITLTRDSPWSVEQNLERLERFAREKDG